MRWIVLSLVLINMMIFAWRYIDTQPQASKDLYGGAVMPEVSTPPGGVLPDSSSVPPAYNLAQQTILLLEELEAKRAEQDGVAISISKGVPGQQVQTTLPLDEVKPVGEGVGTDRCYWVGPMPEEDDRAVFKARLTDFKVEAWDQVVEASGGWRYWIYLEPAASRAEAASQLAVLKKMGIDSYLILKGERKFGVSLGLFSRKVLADAKMEDIQKKGWTPKMDVFERTVKQWWVLARQNEVDALGDDVLGILLKNNPEIQINKKKCKLVLASAVNIQ